MSSKKVTVYVKHYLTPEGILYFEQEWFPRVYSIISKQPGFVFITERVEGPCAHISLQFEDDRTFEEWLVHPSHDSLVNALNDYRDRVYFEAVRTDNEVADPSQLEWTIYKAF